MKGIICGLLAIILSTAAFAAEPILQLEFEGRVTGNTLTCQRTIFSCPSTNHFGAPWGEDSMVGNPLFERVKGKLYVAYTRGKVTFFNDGQLQILDTRVGSGQYGQTNIIFGEMSVGGDRFDLDRDYKSMTGGIREVGYLDAFNLFDRPSWPRAGFTLNNHSQSGHSYYGQINEQRVLLKKFYVTTQVTLGLQLFELPKLERYFDDMAEKALPGFAWDNSIPGRVDARSSVMLRDFKQIYSEGVGYKKVQHTTTVRFNITSIKATPFNQQLPDPEPGLDPPGQVPGPPNPVQIEVD